MPAGHLAAHVNYWANQVQSARTFSMIALVYSFVDALPPKSPVMLLPSAIVCIG